MAMAVLAEFSGRSGFPPAIILPWPGVITKDAKNGILSIDSQHKQIINTEFCISS